MVTDETDKLAQSDAEPQPKSKCGAKRCDDLGCFGYCEAQSNAEPVAWRWRYNEPPSQPWILTDDRFAADRLASRSDIDVESLYTAPPRPDASGGLIEAAEWLDTAASRFEEASDALRSEYKTYAQQLDRWAGDTRQRAKIIRARAADRSTK